MAGILDLIGALTGVSRQKGGLTQTTGPDGQPVYGYEPMTARNPRWDFILSGGRGRAQADRMNEAILPLLLGAQEQRETSKILEGLRSKNAEKLEGQKAQSDWVIEEKRGENAIANTREQAASARQLAELQELINLAAKNGVRSIDVADLMQVVKGPRIETAGSEARTELELARQREDYAPQAQKQNIAGMLGSLIQPFATAQKDLNQTVAPGTTLLERSVFSPEAPASVFRGMSPFTEESSGGYEQTPKGLLPRPDIRRSGYNAPGYDIPLDPDTRTRGLDSASRRGRGNPPAAGELTPPAAFLPTTGGNVSIGGLTLDGGAGFTPNVSTQPNPSQPALQKPVAMPTMQPTDDPVGLPPGVLEYMLNLFPRGMQERLRGTAPSPREMFEQRLQQQNAR